ncbi:hypothetical protein AGMMS49992_13600 [Clostridia bacterium]|nr:hypothetical protein AGMMS49992_13600 [Clostridia bacterium]
MPNTAWQRVKTDDLLRQARTNPSRMIQRIRTLPADAKPSLASMLRLAMERQGLTPSGLMRLTGLSKQYMYQILNDQRVPGRNALLVIALLLSMGFDDVQRLLRTAQKPQLYVKISRDAAIICAIERYMTLEQTNELLTGLGECPLTVV